MNHDPFLPNTNDPIPPRESDNRLSRMMGWVAMVGLLLSAELTRIHWLIHTDPAYHALCDLGGGISCGAVALSPYSVWFGAPVSAWGFLTYLVIALLAIWGFQSRRLHETWPSGLLWVLTAAACLVSLNLAYLSTVKIRSLCLYCSGLHLVNAFLLALASSRLEKLRFSPVKAVLLDLRAMKGPDRTLWATVIPAVLAAIFLSSAWPKYWNTAVDPPAQAGSTGLTEKGENWIGADDPKIIILEFTDYECPLCRRAHWKVRSLLSRYPGKIRLVHKHFPLQSSCNPLVKRPFHRNACRLSSFVSCAGLQEKFWQANDSVFSALETTASKDISVKHLSASVGLDLSRLYADMAAGTTSETIQNDVAEGIRLGVKGTPTFFVNGVQYDGTIPEQVLAGMLREGKNPPSNNLKTCSSTRKAGTP